MIKTSSQRHEPRHVLITGASGGLGAALAQYYARRGNRLTLWGRDIAKLENVASRCSALGARVATRSLDLADHAAALAAFVEDDHRDPVEIAIFNAGLSDIRKPEAVTEDPAVVASLGLVNYLTPSVLATEAAGRMVHRGAGQIVIMGSVAAFHDLPFGTAYSGSKAGLARFASALGLHVRPKGVRVLLVSPGFIDTDMSRRLDGARPFLVSAGRAAGLIARASARGRRHLLFPWPFAILRVVDAVAPYWLRARLLGGVTLRQSPR